MSAGPWFSLDGWADLLRAFAGRGYRCVGFESLRPAERHLVLRHDIDMSVSRAVAMAEIEHGLGVSAHYFVLVSTELYNPFSPANLAGLARLAALGHAVGLHFDAETAGPGADRAAMESLALGQCALLEQALDRPVRHVSFHKPPPALQGLAGSFAGRLHCYQPEFFTQIGYCSDSRGEWHYGHPLEHPAVADGRALQLLTHPVWWVGAASDSPEAKLDHLVREQSAHYTAAMVRNCRTYRDALTRRVAEMLQIDASRLGGP